MNKKFKKIIAIDGPAGSGKSTIAKILASKLSTLYIDTGAMYRAVTFKALKEGIDLENSEALSKLINSVTISLQKDKDVDIRILLDNSDITEKLRSKKINENISKIAKNKEIRKKLVKMQRELGKNGGVVEGRDISTVVFPEAYRKFYLDAHLEERIKRRLNQIRGEGRKTNEETVKNEVINRDRSDRTRKISPLRIAEDAIYIDTTNLSVDEVVQKLLSLIKSDV
jgi:cytidylate kinase